MSLSYQERFGQSRRTEETRDCFGRDAYFDPNDAECRRCHLFNACEERIGNSRQHYSPLRTSRTSRTSRNIRTEDSEEALPRGEAGIVREEETGGERFLYDLLTGAARGAFWEAYQFFCNFRFGKRRRPSDD